MLKEKKVSCKINLFVSRIIIVVFFSLSCAQTIMANCRMGNISVPLNHVFIWRKVTDAGPVYNIVAQTGVGATKNVDMRLISTNLV